MPRVSAAWDVVQVSDPATPAAGRQFLYFKSDGLLYTKKSSGVVTAIDAVPSVAGRTGAITLTAADIAAGTFPAGAFIFTDSISADTVQPSGLTGATAAVRFVGGTASGAPASGTWTTGDVVVAQNGHIWICTAGGTPGTWVDAGSAGAVSSVAGRTGAVTLTAADIASGTFPGAYTLVGVLTESGTGQQALAYNSNANGVVGAQAIELKATTAATAIQTVVLPGVIRLTANYWTGLASAAGSIDISAGVVNSAGAMLLTFGDGGSLSNFKFRGPVDTGALTSASAAVLTNTLTATALVSSGLTGATSASRYVGATTTGAPTGANPFVIGDFVIARDGHMWVCTTAGSPGTWTEVGASVGPVSSVAGRTGAVTLTAADIAPGHFTGTQFIFDRSPRIASDASAFVPVLEIFDLKAGQTTPNKYIAVQNGQFQIMNNGFSAIMTLTDAGALTAASTISGTDLQVSGASISRGVVSGGYAQITANSTTNATTTALAVSGLSITVTLVAGRRYRLSGMLVPFSTVANDVAAVQLRDTATLLQGLDVDIQTTSRGYNGHISVVFTCVASGAVAGTSLNAGSHTFNAYIQRDSGTGTINLVAAATNPNYILLEDIGT